MEAHSGALKAYPGEPYLVGSCEAGFGNSSFLLVGLLFILGYVLWIHGGSLWSRGGAVDVEAIWSRRSNVEHHFNCGDSTSEI